MGAPGTLIPAEAPGSNLQSFGLDTRSVAELAENFKCSGSVFEKGTGPIVAGSTDLDGVAKFGNLSPEIASLVGTPSTGTDGKFVEKNQTERFEHDFGKLLPSLCRSQEGSPGTAGKASAAQKLQVKDVSKYVISAAKNPDFASKLHAVLLENGASSPLDFLSDLNPQMLENVNLWNGERFDGEVQCEPLICLSNNEQSLIPFTGLMSLNNAAEVSNKRQQEAEFDIVSCGNSLPSVTTSEGFVLVCSGTNEAKQTNDSGGCGVLVDQSKVVPRTLDLEKIPFKGQSSNSLAGDGGRSFKDKTGKVFNNIEKDKDTDTVQNERISPMMGEVAEWEIPLEDLQIGERIGIGKNLFS